MRTTLDIDEDILLAAKSIALERKISIGAAISELARHALSPKRRLKVRNGVPLFALHSKQPITPEMVQELLGDE